MFLLMRSDFKIDTYHEYLVELMNINCLLEMVYFKISWEKLLF